MTERAGTTVLLSWGRKPRAVSFHGWQVDLLGTPDGPAPLKDPLAALLDALDSPDGLPRFDEWVSGARSVVIVLPDLAEDLPLPQAPLAVIDKLLSCGIPAHGITMIVATGLGPFRGWKGHPVAPLRGSRGVELIVTDPADTASFEPAGEVGKSLPIGAALGVLSEIVRITGGQRPSALRARSAAQALARHPLRIHRQVLGADRVITISAVVPDALGGYSGGGQAVLPGLADPVSAAALEDLGSVSLTAAGRLEGNPARESMDAASKLLGQRILAIDCVPAPRGGVAGFAAGSPWLTVHKLAALAREAFGVSCRPAPCLVVSTPDGRLEDLVLAASSVVAAVRSSGTVLLASECRRGAASPDRVRALFDKVLAPRLGGAMALVHTPLDPRDVLRSGLRPVRSIPSALEIMKDRAGGELRVAVVQDARRVLPVN